MTSRAAILTQLEHVAREYLTRRRAPGVSIAIDVAPFGIISYSHGLVDARTSAPCRPATRFAVGSITKQFTAAAILQLVAQGCLSLDDAVGNHFDLVEADPRIRVRHLLAHTAGLPLWGERQVKDGGGFAMAPERLLAEVLECEPGARWCYSNAGFAILGRLIEKCSNQSYSEFINQHVIRRAGLRETTVGPVGNDTAVGHAVVASGFGTVEHPRCEATFASGSIYSSASDLLFWKRSLSSGAVIDAAAFDMMCTPYTLNGGKLSGYGLGLFTAVFANTRELSQDGNTGGFSSQLAFYPDVNIAIAVLTNGASHDAEALEKSLVRWLMGVPTLPLLDLETPQEEIASIVGEYKGAASRVSVSLHGSQVFVRTPGGSTTRLIYQGCGTFAQESDTSVLVTVESAGHLNISREGKRLAELSRESPIQ